MVSENGLADVIGLGVCEEDGLAAVEGLLFVGDCEVLEVLGWQWVLVTKDNSCWILASLWQMHVALNRLSKG